MSVYKLFERHKAQLAVLIDPDKAAEDHLSILTSFANQGKIQMFFVGGSLTFTPICPVVEYLKNASKIPVILFPGNESQICNRADAILFLSLISGRNPEYLIGKHVQTAYKIHQSGIEVIPTGYILIEGNATSTTQYITQTFPIPANNTQLAVATALAGQLLGMKAIYLEAGSNANKTVPQKIISQVKQHISQPLIVGGGIKSTHQAKQIIDSGADIVVIGTAAEENPQIIEQIAKVFPKY